MRRTRQRVPTCGLTSHDRVSGTHRAEVTLIEGVRSAHLAEDFDNNDWAKFFFDDEPACDGEPEAPVAVDSRSARAWADAVKSVLDGRAINRLGRGALLRPEAIRTAALAERRAPGGFLDRIDELTSQMPPLLRHDDPTQRVSPLRRRHGLIAPLRGAPGPLSGVHPR